MRRYYLFVIKKDYYEIYVKHPQVLYKTLENLYKLKRENINYGISLYQQICNIIDVKRLQNYFNYVNKKHIRNKYLLVLNDENIIFDIHYSCIICKTNKNFPSGLKVMNYYDKSIFVCDFDNKDYFFLNNRISTSNYKYNYA